MIAQVRGDAMDATYVYVNSCALTSNLSLRLCWETELRQSSCSYSYDAYVKELQNRKYVSTTNSEDSPRTNVNDIPSPILLISNTSVSITNTLLWDKQVAKTKLVQYYINLRC